MKISIALRLPIEAPCEKIVVRKVNTKDVHLL